MRGARKESKRSFRSGVISVYLKYISLSPTANSRYLFRLFSSKNLLPIFCAFVYFCSKHRLRVLSIRCRYMKSSIYFTRELSKRIFEEIISYHSGTTYYNQTITPTAHSVLIRKTCAASTSANFSKTNTEFCGDNFNFSLVEQGYSGKICSAKNFVSTCVNLNKKKLSPTKLIPWVRISYSHWWSHSCRNHYLE